MDQSDLESFRLLLEKQREALLEMRESTRDASQPVELDQTSVGRLSRMDAMQAQQMAQEADRRRALQMAAIDGALRRIDSGDFGTCFACGEEIDPRRLSVDPTTTRCVTCLES